MRESTKGGQAAHLYGCGTLNLFFLALTSMSFEWFSFFCKEMIGGSLKIYWGYSCFCKRFHFFIQASFIVDAEGWYCVTNGNISFSSLLFYFRSLDSLLWILFLIVCFLSKIVGSLRPSSVIFKIWIIFLKGCFWGVFPRILKAPSLTNPFLTFGEWHEVKCVCKKVCLC